MLGRESFLHYGNALLTNPRSDNNRIRDIARLDDLLWVRVVVPIWLVEVVGLFRGWGGIVTYFLVLPGQ